MYYITLRNGHCKSGHIGDNLMFTPSRIDEIVELQIDGDELDRVRRVFPNLSLMPVNSNVVRFYGDYAKSIVYSCFSN